MGSASFESWFHFAQIFVNASFPDYSLFAKLSERRGAESCYDSLFIRDFLTNDRERIGEEFRPGNFPRESASILQIYILLNDYQK